MFRGAVEVLRGSNGRSASGFGGGDFLDGCGWFMKTFLSLGVPREESKPCSRS